MNSPCGECGEAVIWDDSLGSSVCTTCGTLTNPAQNVLASHLDTHDNGRSEYSTWIAGNPTLKSIRNKNGWALSGQGKDVRDRQNMFAMHAFIRTLSRQLENPGISTRAQTMFDQAMSTGNYRWGRKAKLTAGACVAIALRESHKSDALHDISALCDDSPISLSRAFNSVITLLQLDLTSSDPSVHLGTLQSQMLHLISVQGTSEANKDVVLPKALISVIKSLQSKITNVMQTAHSLSALVTQLGTVSHLPTPPTGCAILLLSLEGEYRSPLPNCGKLAQALGTRFGVGKGVVMQRYRVIYDIIEEWSREVPWLAIPGGKNTKAASLKSGRAKRAVVAKALKDVIQFQDEIWRKKLEDKKPVDVDLELSEDESSRKVNSNEESEVRDDAELRIKKRKETVSVSCRRPCKKRKTKHTRTIEEASQFLLHSTSDSKHPSDIGLLAHLLSDSSTLSQIFTHRPTRLQMLVVSRDGGEHSITDEELFEKGELEGLLRSEEEREMYARTVDWEVVEEQKERRRTERMEQRVRGKKRREASEMGYIREQGSKRINMEALKMVMDPASCLDALEAADDGKENELLYFDPDYFTSTDAKDSFPAANCGDTEEEEEDWRPMSPTGDLDHYTFDL